MSYHSDLESKVKAFVERIDKGQKKVISVLNSGAQYSADEVDVLQREMYAILSDMRESMSSWLEKNLRSEYKQGARDATRFLGSLDEISISYQFGQLDNEAVIAIFDEAMTFVDEALSGMSRSAEGILQEARQARIRYLIAEGRIDGDALKQIADRVAGELRSGVVAIVDKSGRKWTSDRYAEMIVRKQMVKSANTGLVNQLSSRGFDLVQVSDHHGECHLCRPWEGKILSITGNTKTAGGKVIHTISEAEAEGLFHPNCRHRLVPFHPEFAGISKKWAAGPYKAP